MKSLIVRLGAVLGGWAVPAFAFAVDGPAVGSGNEPTLRPIMELIGGLGVIVNLLIPIAISAAILFFIWGLAKFILASGDEKKKAEGKARMIWGIAAIFVIVSVLGIVSFVQDLFDIDSADNEVDAPEVLPHRD